VHITSISHVQSATFQGDPEELLRRFFFENRLPGTSRSPLGPDRSEPPLQRERRGEGSGVIARADGYIVTNNHVVSDADELAVRLGDGREFSAQIVGTDPDSDLAVLKINAHDLVPAQLGDSNAAEVGDWVVAVGDPFGLDHTVTAGIISAKGRGELGLATFENFIQTDAAINPGNSGGPLVDMDGDVIGINTAITTRNGGSMGIGFAIPSNMVRIVVDSIVEHGTVQRGWLGVMIQPLTADLARSFGYDGTNGALVGDVVEGAPAAKAGLKAGDIIVGFDKQPVTSSHDLLLSVAGQPPDKDIVLEIFRDGQRKNLELHLGRRPSTQQIETGGYRSEPSIELGIKVETLTPELASRLGLEGQRGVVVARVQPGSTGAQAGLRPGDVIVQVGNRSVRSVAEYRDALAELSGASTIRIRVLNGNASRFVILKPSGD
jgi:serine protease Do